MGYINSRRKYELFILFWLVFFSFAAYSRNYQYHWITVSTMWGSLVLTDFMFLGEDTFLYEANYKSWQIRSGTAD